MTLSSASESAIFVGKVGHSRFAPRPRAFSYKVYMAYLDLDELEGNSDAKPFAGSRLFSASAMRRWLPAQFRREDFYGDAARPLSEEIRSLVQRRTGSRPTGPIRLLANLRTFGYQFNPIAVYYCFEPDGERLSHVVADVSNIPWRESHAYVFSAEPDGRSIDGTAKKMMHVSPFLEMDYTYRLRTAAPTDELGVLVSNSRDDVVEFSAALRLRRTPATARQLRRTLLRFPAMTISVTAKIFWQALKMKLRGYRWYPHAAPLREDEMIEQSSVAKTETIDGELIAAGGSETNDAEGT